MMLVQTSLPSFIEAAHSFLPDGGKQDFLCDWMPGAATWQKCPKCDEHPQGVCSKAASVVDGVKNDNDSCSLNFSTSSELSTFNIMSENSAPTFVYQRRKPRRSTVSVFQGLSSANRNPSDGGLSSISSKAPSMDLVEHVVNVETEAVRSPLLLSIEHNSGGLVSNSESINGCTGGKGLGSEEASRSGMHKVSGFCCLNDSCSSSKSNMNLGSASLKTQVDDTCECSSSGALVAERLRDDMSEKDICISILRIEGLIGGVRPIRTRASAEGTGITSDSLFSRSCKVCDLPESILKMLICDNCEESFHVSCCYPRIKQIPVGDWLCQSCLKKKHKILKEKTSIGMGRCSNGTANGELGRIAFMLKDTGTYATSVRIGEEYQTEVPDWSGPIVDEMDPLNEPVEMNPAECVNLHELSSKKPFRLSSIGNWIQCQEVIGVDGTVCGKWRRAPLLEVQTDDWECFRSVLWDPAHGDCAVPQELDTDEILKQLKYIEMLGPRLAAKRRKLDFTYNVGSQDLTGVVTSTHNP